MASNKMRWAKPQLIVLARGEPEEAVLTHCKRIGNPGQTDPTATAQLGCDKGDNDTCANCQSRSGNS